MIFLPPSWTLKLTESWGKSKNDSKGEVDGLNWRRGWGREGNNSVGFFCLYIVLPQLTAAINVRLSFREKKKKEQTNIQHIIVAQFSLRRELPY